MKRSDALAPLSRDHHLALDAALRLRRAAPGTAEEALARFRAFWAEHGERHFAIEEELLLPAVPQEGGWVEAADRVRREHDELRRRAAAATADDHDALHELGRLLNDHVRFEERELFALAEAILPAAELEALGLRIARAEDGEPPLRPA